MNQSAAAWTEPPTSYAAPIHPYHYSAPPEYHHNPNLIQQQYYYPYPAPNPCPNGTAVVPPPSEPPPAPTEAYRTEQYVPVGGHEGQQAPAPLQPPPTGAAGVGFLQYHTPVMMGAADVNLEALREALRQYGVDPNGYGSSLTSSSYVPVPTVQFPVQHTYQINKVKHPAMKRVKKKPLKPKVKLLQSTYCEVCKVECNSTDVLESHRQGKKHKKNLQKLQEAITPKPAKPPKSNSEKREEIPAAADSRSKETVQEQKGKTGAPAHTENLEAKKQKVLQAGAKVSEVRVCTICNIVVNNQSVFNYHIAGQKHASMVRKQQEVKKSGQAMEN